MCRALRDADRGIVGEHHDPRDGTARLREEGRRHGGVDAAREADGDARTAEVH